MPVSDEKDISRAFAAMLNTTGSLYSLASIFRKFCQDSPAAADRGNTNANTPPGLSLRSANAANAEATPAFP